MMPRISNHYLPLRDDQREVDNSLALIILERNYQSGGLAQLVRAHA